MQVLNKTKNTMLCLNAMGAANFASKLTGLLKYDSLESGQGLLIYNCKAIHTIGMKFNIDVVFISRDYKIVQMLENLKPFLFSGIYRTAFYALELPKGQIAKSLSQIGDDIQIVE